MDKGRLFPRVNPYRHGTTAGVDEIAEDILAMDELEKDTFVAASRTRETRAKRWVNRATARGIEPFPLDSGKLKLLGGFAQERGLPGRYYARLGRQAHAP